MAFAVQGDRATDNLRVAAETSPPQGMTENHDRRAACTNRVGREDAAKSGADAKRRKQVGGNLRRIQSHRLPAPAKIDRSLGVGGDLLKRFRLFTPLQEIRFLGRLEA